MSEYINIISKEAVTAVPMWIAAIGGIIPILLVLSTFIYWAKVKDSFKAARYLGIVGVIAIIIAIVWMCVSCMFFSEPTGRYKYEGTVNKEKITVSEYEEFIEKYNPSIEDGIYYWEDPIT